MDLSNPNLQFKCTAVTGKLYTKRGVKSFSKFGDTVFALTLLIASECCDINKQQYKTTEATEMRFLWDITSHKRTGRKNKEWTRGKFLDFGIGVAEVSLSVVYGASFVGNWFPACRHKVFISSSRVCMIKKEILPKFVFLTDFLFFFLRIFLSPKMKTLRRLEG